MFGSSLFGNDPFFQQHSIHQQQMTQMNQMMQNPLGMMGMDNFMQPFGMPGMSGMPSIQGGQRAVAARRPDRTRDIMPQNAMMSPFGFGGMFPNMNSMMSNMNQMMAGGSNDPNSHFVSHSSVMSYSNDGQGPPKVYQATTATRQAPGGIRETRKTLRDSEAAIEKMSVGRYVGEKGHVKERQRHTQSGDTEENQEFHNLDEEELSEFDNDWHAKTNRKDRRARLDRPRQNARAITDGQSRYEHVRPDHGHDSPYARPHRDQTSHQYADPHQSYQQQDHTPRDRSNTRQNDESRQTRSDPPAPHYEQ